jgi:hypothetical protein
MPLVGDFLDMGREPSVGGRIEQDGHPHQRNAPEQEQGVAHRGGQIVDQHPQYQRNANAHREGHRHARYGNGRHQQDIGHVEHDAPQHRRQHIRGTGLPHILQERPAGLARAPQRKGENHRQQQYADGVIPVKQLEAPGGSGQFLGVGPGAPAQHGDEAEHDGQGVTFDDEHGWSWSLAEGEGK